MSIYNPNMSDEFQVYKLKSFTSVLSKIYADYINVNRADIDKATSVVMSVFKQIEKAMCKEDPLIFKPMFQKTTISGSVGDSLKVDVPDEYYLNMVLKLPECFIVYPSNIPGYVHLRKRDGVGSLRRIRYLPNYLKSTKKSYLLPKQLLRWVRSLLNRAFSDYEGSLLINTEQGQFEVTKIYSRKPGFTLRLDLHGNNEEEEGEGEDYYDYDDDDYDDDDDDDETDYSYDDEDDDYDDIEGEEEEEEGEDVSVNIIPCFEYDCHMLPEKYRRTIRKGKCLIVPEEPTRDIPYKERYWRLYFQDYERDTLCNKQNLKPTIKLLKVLKDNLGHSAIRSYHIKAIALYELQNAGEDEFWNKCLGYCFLHLLRACVERIEDGNIPTVYDSKCNLIEYINISQCSQIASELNFVLKTIIQESDTRTISALLLLDRDDQSEFIKEFSFSETYRILLRNRGHLLL